MRDVDAGITYIIGAEAHMSFGGVKATEILRLRLGTGDYRERG